MTLLIKNVKLLGVAEKDRMATDVFVSGNRISAIGNFREKRADRVIDGQGMYLAPGFIDANTDSDHYLSLFEHPEQSEFLSQGVTTIMGGFDGSSLAPLLYGDLDSVRKWGNVERVNVNWHSLGELLALLKKRPLGVNFGTCVGHSTIRRALLGEQLRTLTKNELEVFGGTVLAAMQEGGYGLSTGLDAIHGRAAPYGELKFLLEIVKKEGGFHAVQLRKGVAGLLVSLDESVRLAKELGLSTLVANFLPLIGEERAYEQGMERIERLDAGLGFHIALHPFSFSVVPLYSLLPLWAQNGPLEKMRENIADAWLGKRIKKELPVIPGDKLKIVHAVRNDPLAGVSFGEFMQMYSLADPQDGLMKLMSTTGLRATVAWHNVHESLLKRSLTSQCALIGSGGTTFIGTGGEHLPRRYPFLTFLSLVLGEEILPLEEAVRKITTVPAKKFGLSDRGEIKEGYVADLTGFFVRQRDQESSIEIRCTIVGGNVAYEDGQFTDVYAGTPLRNIRKP